MRRHRAGESNKSTEKHFSLNTIYNIQKKWERAGGKSNVWRLQGQVQAVLGQSEKCTLAGGH